MLIATGRQGRHQIGAPAPKSTTRSRWSLNLREKVHDPTCYVIQGGRAANQIGATAPDRYPLPLVARHCQKVRDPQG